MEFLETVVTYRELIALCVAMAANLVLAVVQLVRYLKIAPGDLLEKWKMLMALARELEIEAEAVPGLSGAEKLNYVLIRLRAAADDLGYPATDEELTAAINADVVLTKEVNYTKPTVK